MDDEELSPQQAERVRRLLAETRHTEPVPADVAARLDRVIDDLAAEPASSPRVDSTAGSADGAGVVRLDERRRKAGRMLLVAAAVVVGGVAVGQVVDGDISGGADSGSESSAGVAEDEALRAPHRNGFGGQSESEASPDRDQVAPGAVSDHRRSISKRPMQPVRPDRFATDARRLQAVATGRSAKNQSASPELQAHVGAGTCEPGPWGGGRYLRVSFGRDAGWLVYRPPRGDTQVVDLFLCGEDAAERSATLPHR